MDTVARFGENLRSIRKALGLNQRDLAARLWSEGGGPINQGHVSKMEALEWAPRPETVRRLAEALARISGNTIQAEFDRLLDGVSSRFDTVIARRAIGSDPIDRLRSLIEQLPAEKRRALVDALEQYVLDVLSRP